MKVSNHYYGATKDGGNQKFNCYYRKGTNKYVTRFAVSNYTPNGKKHSDWCGKGCASFKTQAEAISFGYKICSSLKRINDVQEIKSVVELHSQYQKVFA
jgi:myo-inositol-hexaphosphate 3-phosphohydrolase